MILAHTALHWIWDHTLGTLYAILVGTLVGRRWVRKVKRDAQRESAKVKDLLDPHTPGGIGDLDLPVKKGTGKP